MLCNKRHCAHHGHSLVPRLMPRHNMALSRTLSNACFFQSASLLVGTLDPARPFERNAPSWGTLAIWQQHLQYSNRTSSSWLTLLLPNVMVLAGCLLQLVVTTVVNKGHAAVGVSPMATQPREGRACRIVCPPVWSSSKDHSIPWSAVAISATNTSTGPGTSGAVAYQTILAT